jgi:chromate transporter
MKMGNSRGSVAEVFAAFLKLGLTSFGGPIAHLGYFRAEFVERRKWLGESDYADLVALSQFLPGPASSQVGIAIRLSRAGYAGALAASTAFTLPSAIALVLFAYGLSALGSGYTGGWLHGLKVAAVVANAIRGVARTLPPDRERPPCSGRHNNALSKAFRGSPARSKLADRIIEARICEIGEMRSLR